jgi:hypothetical protein
MNMTGKFTNCSIGYIPPAEAEVNYYRQLAESNETEVST